MTKFPTTIPDFLITKYHVFLLKRARKMIKSEKRLFICHAIRAAYTGAALEYSNPKDLEKLRRALTELNRYIRRALEGHSTLSDWYRKRNGDGPKNSVKNRYKWIDFILGESVDRLRTR